MTKDTELTFYKNQNLVLKAALQVVYNEIHQLKMHNETDLSMPSDLLDDWCDKTIVQVKKIEKSVE